MKAKTIRLTVLCPYCTCSYTFKTEEAKAKWDGNTPLHKICKQKSPEGYSRFQRR